MISVCRNEDDFLEDKSIWFVDLSNGERIWMDDDRPGAQPRSAWLRLRAYLAEVDADIIALHIKFRSHVESPLPENALGYFFCHRLLASLGEQAIMKSFLIGAYEGEEGLAIQEWRTPELLQDGIEYRLLEEIKPLCLILKRGINVPQMAASL